MGNSTMNLKPQALKPGRVDISLLLLLLHELRFTRAKKELHFEIHLTSIVKRMDLKTVD